MAEEIKTPETEESGKNFIINFIYYWTNFESENGYKGKSGSKNFRWP